MEKDELMKALNTGEIAAAAGQKDEGRAKASWQQLLNDPEYRACYDKAVQAIVQRRLKKRSQAEEMLVKLQPVLDALAECYGVEADIEQMDTQALAQLILHSARKSAEDCGRYLEHLENLLEQEAELKKSVPEFELLQALENPTFIRLTAPHTGIGVADAYYALNRGEIGRNAAQKSLEKISRSIISGGARPREADDNRLSGSFSPDPKSMSKAERNALKRRIYEAGALGTKLYP